MMIIRIHSAVNEDVKFHRKDGWILTGCVKDSVAIAGETDWGANGLDEEGEAIGWVWRCSKDYIKKLLKTSPRGEVEW